MSSDGTPLAVECSGTGPSIVIVHGGTGDRTRWTPLFPLLASQFRVCAMDRRAHGESGDSGAYSLEREVADVVAVVNAQPGPVFVVGHSFGGVLALEAALQTEKITKLALYEPPILAADHSAALKRMETMIAAGDRDQALVTFMRDIVNISTAEIAMMRTRPSWPGLLASVETSIRQDRALSKYRFDEKRVRALSVPTLLLAGSRSTSPELRRSLDALSRSLPRATLYVFDGQEHNAMDTAQQEFAVTLASFFMPRAVPR
jgi:pimeloyl-ACP methyl ester carboxylesterase